MHLSSSFVFPFLSIDDDEKRVVVGTLHAAKDLIAVGLSNGLIYTLNGRCERKAILQGHETAVRALASWDGSHTSVSGARDGSIKIWDLENRFLAYPTPSRPPLSTVGSVLVFILYPVTPTVSAVF